MVRRHAFIEVTSLPLQKREYRWDASCSFRLTPARPTVLTFHTHCVDLDSYCVDFDAHYVDFDSRCDDSDARCIDFDAHCVDFGRCVKGTDGMDVQAVKDGSFRAKREHLERFHGLSPERHGQNLALTALYVPYSLDSGRGDFVLTLYCKVIVLTFAKVIVLTFARCGRARTEWKRKP